MMYIAKLARRLARLRSLVSSRGRSPYFALMVSPLLLVVACAAGEPTGISTESTPALPDPPVVVSPRVMTLEGTQQVAFRAFESDLTTQVTSIEWTASGGSVGADGTYSSTGIGDFRVVGKRTGNPHNLSDTSLVTVVAVQPTLASVVVSPAAASVIGGQQQQYAAAGKMSDGSTVAIGVTWSTTGGTIDAGGLFMAANTAGTFQVIATHVTTGIADTVPVTVKGVQSIALSPGSTSLSTAGTQQFSVTGTLTDGSTVSIATVGYSASGGTISTSGLYTAPLTGGSYTVKAQLAPGTGTGPSAQAAVNVLAATAGGGSAGYPHEPAGLTRFLESAFSAPLTFTPTATTDIAGYEVAAGFNSTPPGIVANATGPQSPGSALQFTYPSGLTVGNSPGVVQFWAPWLGSTTAGGTAYSEIYASHWTKIPEATFQQNSVGTKLFGYIGYGQQGSKVPAQIIMATEGGGATGTYASVTSMPVVFTQQNNVNRRLVSNLNTGQRYVVGRWNRLEIHMKLNSVVNGSDGVIQVWLDNGSGAGLVQIMAYTNITFTTDAAHSADGISSTSGFYGYRWDPVFGGIDNAAGGRTQVNHLLVDHLYISGK
jgi:hypothetical protein